METATVIPRFATPSVTRILTLVLVLAHAGDAAAEKLRDRDKPRNDPIQCPYCEGNPDLMAASGVVSHGGFEFARSDTAGIDAAYPNADIRWVESAHYEIGLAVGTYKVPQKERDKFRAELTRLSELLPNVNPKEKTIDPWLRGHMFVLRLEDLWDQMLGILQVSEEDFPDGTKAWDMSTTYMGEGPYLGQKGKYEVIVWPSEGIHVEFVNQQFGLRVRRTQRYNVIDRDSLIIVAHLQQEGLRGDDALHGHLGFNQTINFLDGYKHYSYDSPVWLLEGMAHWIERSINPNFNSFDASEGGAAHSSRKTDWKAPTRKLATSSKAITLAQMVALRRYSDFELNHHYTCWSMVDYLMQVHPDFLAELWGGLKGITDVTGIADGGKLHDVQRRLFKEELGMSYARFDGAWREWVEENY